ncbi:hypothetical protein [Geobacillus stearothermophilus]|uniref:hypothetical protein n=1 Tax=Geobacillus stearothermophilus TaxID=1422 RepID=UPI002E1ACC85|nr:hypothetical protein [Geobacillus stearothermophilus]
MARRTNKDLLKSGQAKRAGGGDDWIKKLLKKEPGLISNKPKRNKQKERRK